MSAPLDDVISLPGGQFISACIGAVEQQAWVIQQRENSARSRGQAVDAHALREAALLSAAVEMLATLKSDGDRSAADGKEPGYLVKKATVAGRGGFRAVEPAQQKAHAA